MLSAFVLVDIFNGIDDYFNNYLDTIPDVKEKHRNGEVTCHPLGTKVIDYEIILRIESDNPEGLLHSLQRIKAHNGVEDIRFLPIYKQV